MPGLETAAELLGDLAGADHGQVRLEARHVPGAPAATYQEPPPRSAEEESGAPRAGPRAPSSLARSPPRAAPRGSEAPFPPAPLGSLWVTAALSFRCPVAKGQSALRWLWGSPCCHVPSCLPTGHAGVPSHPKCGVRSASWTRGPLADPGGVRRTGRRGWPRKGGPCACPGRGCVAGWPRSRVGRVPPDAPPGSAPWANALNKMT